MDERATDGTEPPPAVAAALAACDVFIAPTSRSLSHTPARKRASDAGARGATMPGVTEDMLARVMAVDFDTMAARSRAVADAARPRHPRARHVPARHRPQLALDGRAGIADDGDLGATGAFGNLPCGEGFIAPAFGEGTVVPSSLAPLGIGEEPATLTVAEGRIVAADGGLGPRYIELLLSHGELGTNLAELGVGHQRPGAADRQRARGREDPRHGARRVRRERRHRRHRVGSDPPRRRHRSTRGSRSDGQTVLDPGRYVLD